MLTIFAIGCNKDNDKSSDNPPCPNIEIHISGDTTIVPGDILNLYATLYNGATYAWTGPAGFTSDSASIAIPEVTSLQGGYYIVTANINGICTTAPDTFLVTVDCDTPENTMANYYSPVASDSTLYLYSTSLTDSVSYIWTGPNGFTSTLQNPVIPSMTAANNGTYIVYSYKGFCYDNPDSVTVNFSECNPSNRTFAKSTGENTFLYSFGSSNAYPNTRTLSGNSFNGNSLRVTFPGLTQPAGVYTVNPAHCPPFGGPLAATECCVEYGDTIGNYIGVSGTVSLTGEDAVHFCGVPFKLQFTTTTLFTGAGKMEY